jgi:hypothetical protein
MDVMSLPSNSLVRDCQKLIPGVRFEEASSFYWSPKKRVIYMNSPRLDTDEGRWALVHEVSHALLDHRSYQTDADLLMLEVAAWEKARELCPDLALEIDEEHIQECLNTYRDWLYARSTCPTCMLNSLQIDETAYQCLNCSTRWSVSGARFCRPYRMQSRHKKTPPEVNQTVFS